jgi:hypothetical protein
MPYLCREDDIHGRFRQNLSTPPGCVKQWHEEVNKAEADDAAAQHKTVAADPVMLQPLDDRCNVWSLCEVQAASHQP